MKSNKIIAVLNDNGNVAKSTITNFAIFPRLKNNPEVIYCEAGNSIPGEIKKTAHGKAKCFGATQEEFAEMIDYLMMNVASHDIIVDFGSTDSSLMRALFVECPGSIDVFDLFIVPTSPDVKQADTETTINFLAGQGVTPEKIRVVFTLFPAVKKLERVFHEIFEAHKEVGNFTLDPKAVLYKSLLIDRLNGSGYTIEDMLNDKSDWKQKIIDAHPQRDDPEVQKQIKTYTWMNLNRGFATSMVKDFDVIFNSVMSNPQVAAEEPEVKKSPAKKQA